MHGPIRSDSPRSPAVPFPCRAAGRRTLLPALLLAWLAAAPAARAGHESAFYPSFYPQEIRIEAMGPAAAGAALQKNTLHAYIGPDPFAGGTSPAHVRSIESFGSYLVATFNAASPPLRDARRRCAAARGLAQAVAEVKDAFVFFPYPVTPFHPDYLHHFDAARAWAKGPPPDPPGKGPGPAPPRLRVKAQGVLAERIAGGRWPAAGEEWDAALEEVGPPDPDWRPGPPWMKEGWFHAYRLLADGVQDRGRRDRLDRTYRQLTEGAYADAAEKVNLERALVSLLTQGCERIVLGYTVRRTVFNDEFSHGIENVAVDALAGPLAPIFVRTVKLKDFPWNGTIRVGVEGRPTAAWNPFGGFGDPLGRLLWSAVGDLALLPAPSGGSWIAARVTATVAPSTAAAGKVAIPPDALAPDPERPSFRPVGPGRVARAKALYRIPASLFHDGTRMTVADLVYPFAFAHRWGTPLKGGAPGSDPGVGEPAGLARKWLAAFRVVKTEQIAKEAGALRLEWSVPVIEVYLNHAALDPQQTAAAAPPWSSLPWHLVALMEEAVARGVAAFSAGEAQRRGVPWLDLARDEGLHARLLAWAEEFERAAHVPEALKGFVSPEEARQRWGALRRFHQKHRHLLVTNGPYRLDKWSADAAVLQVFRDTSYPLGVGAFDVSVLPPKARITRVDVKGAAAHLAVEMEKPVRAQRSYTWVREALARDAMAGGYPVLARCAYIVLGADGKVRRAGAGRQEGDGTFRLDLKGLPAGAYTVLAAVSLNGNTVHPDVRAFPYRAAP